MRAQGFALSKMKGRLERESLPSSKFGIPSTKDMYSGWSTTTQLSDLLSGFVISLKLAFL